MDLLKERMAHLSAALERMEQHEKSIPQIEIDLALEDLRRMYDALYQMPVDKSMPLPLEATEPIAEEEVTVEPIVEKPNVVAPIVASTIVEAAAEAITTTDAPAEEENLMATPNEDVAIMEAAEVETVFDADSTPQEETSAETPVEAVSAPAEQEIPAAQELPLEETINEENELNPDDLFAPPTPEEQAPLPENELPSLAELEGDVNDELFEDESAEDPIAPETPVSKAEALGQLNGTPTLWEKLQQQQAAPSVADAFQKKEQQTTATVNSESVQPTSIQENAALPVEEPQTAEPEAIPTPIVEETQPKAKASRPASTGSLFDFFNGAASQANQTATNHLSGIATSVATPTPVQPETPKTPETPKAPETPQAPEAPTAPQPKTTITAPSAPVRTLADTFGANTQSTIAGNSQQDSISRRQKVVDLRTIININDKFSFMNELFHNNMKAYNDFILRLNAIDNREEAMAVVDEIAMQYNWDRNSLSATTFFSILDRKF